MFHALMFVIASAAGEDARLAVQRFPPPEVVKSQIALAREAGVYWRERAKIEAWQRRDIDLYLLRLRDAVRPWELLRDAQEFASWENYVLQQDWKDRAVRQSLRELRLQIGEEAYWQGRMPPPLPVDEIK